MVAGRRRYLAGETRDSARDELEGGAAEEALEGRFPHDHALEPDALDPAQPEAEDQPVLKAKRWRKRRCRACGGRAACACACCLSCLLGLAVLLLLLSLPRFNAALLSWTTSLIYGPFYGDHSNFQHEPKGTARAPLRIDWSHTNSFVTGLARLFNSTQNPPDCAGAKFTQLTFHAAAGLGANLHGWTQDLCEVSARNGVLVTQGPWVWRDPIFCGSDLSFEGFAWLRRALNLFDYYPGQQTAMECYFGRETYCTPPDDAAEAYLYGNGRTLWQSLFFSPKPGMTETYMVRGKTFEVLGGSLPAQQCSSQTEVRQAGIELLFQSLPERVIAAAER